MIMAMMSAMLPITSRNLFDCIVTMPTAQRQRIADAVAALTEGAGLDWALRALFRQQVFAGYVLFDPAEPAALREKRFAMPGLVPPLRLQWNPQRELRLDHTLLRGRGVISKNADSAKLINRNAAGNACYLCPENIAIQTPGEIVISRNLSGKRYFLGANFAPITDNHFTVISSEHRPQRYHIGILRAGFDLVTQTGGTFRALFNGLAGASILEHEHLHATDACFPIEDVSRAGSLLIASHGNSRALRPDYPIPLWLVEGPDVDEVIMLGDRLIESWHAVDPQRHSENLLMAVENGTYRLFIVPRDLARMTAPGRTAAMGSFETAGLIVLSHPSEQPLFESADHVSVARMLEALTPERLAHTSIAPQELGF